MMFLVFFSLAEFDFDTDVLFVWLLGKLFEMNKISKLFKYSNNLIIVQKWANSGF